MSAARQTLIVIALFVSAGLSCAGSSDPQTNWLDQKVPELIAAHAPCSGIHILDRGEEALLARAWLADHAERTLDIQYFIWSVDHIGILAAEALLRAADRGVRVRVLVDDFLINSSDEQLLAMAAHPGIEIRVYNPRVTVGVSPLKRFWNMITSLRDVNQRMHNKTFIVDNKVAIIGGRNMADEYFDYDHRYNYRDRDLLLLGPVVSPMSDGFETFWNDSRAVPVAELLKRRKTGLAQERVQTIYAQMHEYAGNPRNFSPEIRSVLLALPGRFPALADSLIWSEARFIGDQPGKNKGTQGFSGGGETTRELIGILQSAKRSVTIQSPYLVMPEGGLALFKRLVQQGVVVRIITNSLAATDNLQAFSGYRKQRSQLLKAGIQVREFRPDAAVRKKMIEHYELLDKTQFPIFALHAKTMVVDGETLFVGTFNLDPRSSNLNTEVGVVVKNALLAGEVERAIDIDMLPENSWNAVDNPDAFATAAQRWKLRFWELLPMQALL